MNNNEFYDNLASEYDSMTGFEENLNKRFDLIGKFQNTLPPAK